jgi:DNA relaxase NicK
VGKVTATGCDWLTTTATERRRREWLWDLGLHLLHRRKGEGEHPTGWHANGYSGLKALGVILGARADSVILRLSGAQAAEQWVQAAATGENLTRLDLAVDVEANPPVTVLARQVYEDAGHVPSKNGRPPSRSRFVDGNGGQTTYIGSRASEQMGRLYDKGVERKARPAGTWWRWEVEYKGEHAHALTHRLLTLEDRESAMLQLVAQWFGQRSRNAPPAGGTAPKYFVERKLTTDEERLEWLAIGVRPTVTTLIERLGSRRVLTALGISPEERSVRPEPPQSLMRVRQCQQ